MTFYNGLTILTIYIVRKKFKKDMFFLTLPINSSTVMQYLSANSVLDAPMSMFTHEM
ncbi:MAG: hypothetical protein ACJAZ2_000667 [Glaciecola sp.]|jgi:hypothetical protein